jgi:hypothetical protein
MMSTGLVMSHEDSLMMSDENSLVMSDDPWGSELCQEMQLFEDALHNNRRCVGQETKR